MLAFRFIDKTPNDGQRIIVVDPENLDNTIDGVYQIYSSGALDANVITERPMWELKELIDKGYGWIPFPEIDGWE